MNFDVKVLKKFVLDIGLGIGEEGAFKNLSLEYSSNCYRISGVEEFAFIL